MGTRKPQRLSNASEIRPEGLPDRPRSPSQGQSRPARRSQEICPAHAEPEGGSGHAVLVRLTQPAPETALEELLECCTHHAPQIYWMPGVDPAGQLERSIDELNRIRKLPFVPVGPAFSAYGWTPTVNELVEFHEAYMAEGCERVLWWEYQQAEKAGFFPLLAELEWLPPALSIQEKVDQLWAYHPELHPAGSVTGDGLFGV